MKITKLQVIIHSILAVVFTIVFLLISTSDGEVNFGEWIFWTCTMITLLNTLFLCGYSNKTHAQDSEMMDYSLIAPPVVAYIIFAVVAVKAGDIFDYSIRKYLVFIIVILSISAIVQILLINVRKGNIRQESETKSGRYNRDDFVRTWDKITESVQNHTEIYLLSKRIANEIRFSDPISIHSITSIEELIVEKSDRVFNLIKTKEYDVTIVVNMEKEILELIKDRDSKLRSLK